MLVGNYIAVRRPRTCVFAADSGPLRPDTSAWQLCFCVCVTGHGSATGLSSLRDTCISPYTARLTGTRCTGVHRIVGLFIHTIPPSLAGRHFALIKTRPSAK
jgi:hypothetical protein